MLGYMSRPLSVQQQILIQLPLHLAAHEAGHAVMAHHLGYVDITAVSKSPIESAIQLDWSKPPQQAYGAYLLLAAAGAAAEDLLFGNQFTDQLKLKREDFSLDQDVVKFLVAWKYNRLLYPGISNEGLDLDEMWVQYQSLTFRSAWIKKIGEARKLFQDTLAIPLEKTRIFLQNRWGQHLAFGAYKANSVSAEELKSYLIP